jgi:WD40 repeat protein
MRVLFFILLCSVSLRAAPVSFRAEIAPILRAQCQSCHGAKDAKGDFRVDSYAELMRALKGEPARVLRGNANDSLLHQLLVTLDKSDRMPRKSEPLTAQQIALIKRWIDEGAKFDGGDPKALLVQVIPARVHAAAPEKYSRDFPITALAFSPDASQLAVGGLREITLWNVADGKLIRRIPNMSQRTFALSWLSDGRTILAGGGIPGELGEVRAFSLDGKLQAVVHQAGDVVLDLQLDANATRLAVADADNLITLYNVADYSRLRQIDNHADWVMALAFSPDGKNLASASRDRTAKIFDLKNGEAISTYGGHKTPVQGVAFRADGREVFSTDRSGTIHVWKAGLADIEGKRFGAEKVAQISNLGRDLYKLHLHGNSLLSYGSGGRARMFQAKDRKPMHAFAHANVWLMAVAWSGKAGRLATGAHDGSVCVWKTADGKLLKCFTALPR